MESITAYIPMDRRLALAENRDLPDRARGAVIFADISGFVPLTEMLVNELGRQRGAEEVFLQLNRVHSALIDEVHQLGGSVIAFSGDAVSCWFDGDDGRLATACALSMQRVMRELTAVRTPSGATVSVAIKAAVAAGAVRRFLVGDPRVRLLDVLAGTPVDRAAGGEKLARRGEVVAGEEVISFLADGARVDAWRRDSADRRYGVIEGVAEDVEAEPQLPRVEAGRTLREAEIRPYLLPAVFERLRSGQGEFLAEIRPAAALFLKFGGLDWDRDDEAGAKLDTYVRAVQAVVSRYDGSLLDLTTGDKGNYLYAAFGAPIAHEDDCARAVSAALALHEPAGGIRPIGIGLSYGRLSAGAFGGRRRRAYSVMGAETNMAARLMEKAAEGQVLVSGRIARSAASGHRFEALGHVTVKGKDEPISVFEVRSERRKDRRRERVSHAETIIGRKAERRLLGARLDALEHEGASGVLFVEGEPGIGKSRLVEDLLEQVREREVRCLEGHADAIETSTAYYVWRQILRQLFSLSRLDDSEATRSRVLESLTDSDHKTRQLAPLLNAMLPLDLPASELTEQMTGKVRGDNTHDLVTRLLNRDAARSPLLVVVEDAHWLDSASWALLARVARGVHPMLLVVTTRPLSGTVPREYRRLVAAPTTRRLVLGELCEEETLALVRRRLGVRELPMAITTLIRDKAEGNPFFCEELIHALHESGSIQVGDGICRISPETGDLGSLRFPNTIEGVVTSRIDRLSPAQQMILKVASVVGRVFPMATLRAAHPTTVHAGRLKKDLDELANLEITPLESPEPNLRYIFKHVITREVAYNLMLVAQRRQLHRAIAEWTERTAGEDPGRLDALLAHHWSEAAETTHGVESVPAEKAIGYLERAGEQAVRDYANREAAGFFGRAINLERRLRNTAGPDPATDPTALPRRAHWHARLGQVCLRLGDFSASRRHFLKALKLFGKPIPEEPGVASLLGQIVRQLVHRLIPGYPRAAGAGSAEGRVVREISRTCYSLAEAHAFAGEPLRFLFMVFYTLNQSERVAPCAELAEAYVGTCYVLGLTPLRRLAGSYRRRADAVADRVDRLATRARVLLMTGLQAVGAGHWRAALTRLEEGQRTCEYLGNVHRWGECAATLANACLLTGDVTRGAELAGSVAAAGRRLNNPFLRSHGLQFQALAALRRGEFEEVVEQLEEALPLHKETAEQQSEILVHGLLAYALLHRGEPEAALEAAGFAVEQIGRQGLPTMYYTLWGYCGVAAVYLELWRRALEAPQRVAPPTELTHKARDMVKALHKYRRVFPIGRPAAWLYQARYERLDGHPHRARRAWRKSQAAGRRLSMPTERGSSTDGPLPPICPAEVPTWGPE
ncbi:MAG: AAA family ATPase [bacterium]|nr:AAA family ATPase [bacterium]